MRINHNTSSFNTWRMQSMNTYNTQKSLEKLSSGLRINRASDDAAGLTISEKMRAQIRGLGQTARNIQDSISLVQTAEAGMTEIHALLQRGRELSVQASSGTNTVQDKQNIQSEIDQIVKEVDRISATSEFNTIKLLNVASSDQDKINLLNSLKNSWLGQAENLIKGYYGLEADNYTMTVFLDEGAVGGQLAYVSALVPGTGLGTNLELHIEMADYRAGNITDRVLAHEMVHAVFNRSINVGTATGIPTWFNEGSAELIHGADERLNSELAALGGNTTANRTTIVNNATDAWGSTSQEYAGAFAAVRYMHDKIQTAGGTGINQIFNYLKADTTRTLDQALTSASSGAFTGLADFQTDWAAEGEDFIEFNMNLSNTDTGAIGGFDADGGTVRTDTSVVPDTAQSVVKFNMVYPDVAGATPLSVQIGANSGQTLGLSMTKADSSTLGISSADVVNNAETSIGLFDTAIVTVAAERARFGALQNRMEHALSVTMNSEENLTSSESRIRDADIAKEMLGFTKNNILSQASLSMLSQANQVPQGVLQLLR